MSKRNSINGNKPLHPLSESSCAGFLEGEPHDSLRPGKKKLYMIISDKLSIRIVFIAVVIFLAGTVTSCKHMITPPPLELELPAPDKTQPQAADMADIRWTANATGGVGSYTYEFHLRKGKEDRVVQSGPLPYWDWSPDEPGRYRVKAVVRDFRENTADSGWSPEYEIVPELLAEEPVSDKTSPQAANMADVKWSANAAGGVGSYTYEFHLRKGKEDRVVQSGALTYWRWKPGEAGRYRIKAVVRDTLGNAADSGWSPEYEIVPELIAEISTADKTPPQAANMTSIRWTVKAAGGVGVHMYEFHILKGDEDRVVQSGDFPYLDWKPGEAGLYRVKAVVRDTLGNAADSGWSPEYEIVLELIAEILTADKTPPQAANMTSIRWTVKAAGGVGVHMYEFHILKGNEDRVVQSGDFPYLDWKPGEAGLYRVKAVVRDSLGNAADSGWSPEYEIVPELIAEISTADKTPPQAANMADIRWTVKAAEGVGARTFAFHIIKGKDDRVVQSGALSFWDWKPGEAGLYRVKAVVSDTLGNTAESGWSSEYEIVPELSAEEPVADRTPPQAANMAKIRWTVKTAGGVGTHMYEFHILKGNEDRIVQTETMPYWDWSPHEAGTFRVKAVVRDIRGNTADSGWSPGYEIRRFLKSSLIAVLPVENLSGTKAPVKKIGQLLKTELKREGFHIIDDDTLEGFMYKYRIRYTGAIDLTTAAAFQKEIGVEAVLITSIELYSELYPPKISVISRLTSTGSKPEIMWMDSVGLSGDDSPGILGLGLIEDPEELLMNAVQSLSERLNVTLWGPEELSRLPGRIKKNRPALIVTARDGGEKPVHDKKPVENRPGTPAFVPKIFYRSPILSPDMKYRVAVMPFLNKSERKNAGDIMTLHFTEQLREIMNYDVVEPGIVRNNLLGFRIIMNEGISFENAGFIFSTLETDADLILSGTVLDYQDNVSVQGTPKVDFSVLVIEKKSREVVWSSKSYRTGDENVIFFDKGQINVAHSLASGMARGVAEMLLVE